MICIAKAELTVWETICERRFASKNSRTDFCAEDVTNGSREAKRVEHHPQWRQRDFNKQRQIAFCSGDLLMATSYRDNNEKLLFKLHQEKFARVVSNTVDSSSTEH